MKLRLFLILPSLGNVFDDAPTIASLRANTVVFAPSNCPTRRTSCCLENDASCPAQRCSVSTAFASPDVSALTAPVIWGRAQTRHFLVASTSSVSQHASKTFDVASLLFKCHLHFGPNNLRLLIASDPKNQVTIQIEGAMQSVRRIALTFHSLEWDGLDQHAAAFDVLAHFANRRRLNTPPDRPGSAETRWIRNALIAFDGQQAGASQREIAKVIYGTEAEANAWSDRDGWLRSMVRRDIRRGQRLVESEWRRMVADGSFSNTT